MQQIFYDTVGPISQKTGFCYRTVYVHDENSKLHSHDFYEIFLTLSDSIIHNINGSKETLKQGTLVFIRKEDTHCYEYTSNKNVSFINLSFDNDILMELFSYLTDGCGFQELLTASFPPNVILNEGDIQWFLKQIETLNATSSSDIPLLKYRCRLLLLKIFTRYFAPLAESESDDSHAPLWLSKLNIDMQKLENFSQGPQYMVEMSGKCRAYLGRMIKQYYGKTIPDYINDLRLNYWANSLLTSDTPIIDICYECGFENVGWAYTLFKKRYGMSPLKYRKNNYKE